jgi:hypothetical protein
MKLSEYVMLGSTLIESVPYVRWNGRGGGCALGMAESALGLKRVSSFTNMAEVCEVSIEDQPGFEWMNDEVFTSPCGCRPKFQVSAVQAIVHIFNHHVHGEGDWTLEKLCDWVRSIEPQEETTEVKRESLCLAEVEQKGV